jgi:hypothetical protein
MRHFGGFGLLLFCGSGLIFGQGRSAVVSSGFGQISSPARSFAGTWNRNSWNGSSWNRSRGTGTTSVYAYPVPIYVGGYGYGSGYADPPAQDPSAGQDAYGQNMAPPPQAPPPGAAPGAPPQQTTIIINPSPDGSRPNVTVLQGPPPGYGPPPQGYGPPPGAGSPTGASANSDSPAPYFLIALKDHTVYSAVAYWVDGDTLHYFTDPDTHNQVSLALVDRDLTQRLNKEAGIDVTLPAPSAAAR